MKIYKHDAGHMTKMAAMPLYGKNPSKNLLLRNRWADFHETWNVALGTPAIHSLFKYDTLAYFTAMSNLVTQAFL